MQAHSTIPILSELSLYRYKIELHAHTAPVSSCGKLSPEELLAHLKKNGYDAVVITNHFHGEAKFAKSEDPIAAYLSDYYAAKKAGEAAGIRVLLGAEYRFSENHNDYLVFGVDEEFLQQTLSCYSMSYADFYRQYRGGGRLFIQAHPFRPGIAAMPPEVLDGIEIFNLHPGHNSQIGTATRYARENGFDLFTVGTDVHQDVHVGLSALRSKTLPETEAELVQLLLSRDYLFEIAGCPVLPYEAIGENL